MLEEYEILKEVLEITSIRNISHASVKIVFRRRIEYHITNTLLQVIIKVTHPNFCTCFNQSFVDFYSSYGWLLVLLF